jgi:hypothetical protein
VATKRIEEFLSKGAKPDPVRQFEKLSAGKNKEEVRELEMAMLTPEPIPQYVGEEQRYIMNSEFTVKMVFASQEDMDFFGRFIPIANYMEKSITDLKIMFDLFRSIDAGKISYDKKTGVFQIEAEKSIELPKLPTPPSARTIIEGVKIIGNDTTTPIKRFFRR